MPARGDLLRRFLAQESGGAAGELHARRMQWVGEEGPACHMCRQFRVGICFI